MVHANQILNFDELKELQLDELASICATTTELTRRLGIVWSSFEDDGLGECMEAVLRSGDGSYFGILHHPRSPRSDLLTLCVSPERPDYHIDEALITLGLGSSDLRWIRPSITMQAHSLFREDDNGVRFHIADFPCRADAHLECEKLSFYAHKQAYFVEPSETAKIGLLFDSDALHAPVPVI